MNDGRPPRYVTGAGVSIQTYDLKGRPEYGEYTLPDNA